MKEQLLKFYEGKEERCGFILEDGTIIECKNHHDDPSNGFYIGTDDLFRYEDSVVASWHTHPDAGSNLSPGDYESFMNYPNWDHYIVGDDGVKRYRVIGGVLEQS